MRRLFPLLLIVAGCSEPGRLPDADADLQAVRAWLRENLDSPDWEEVRWWPTRPMTHRMNESIRYHQDYIDEADETIALIDNDRAAYDRQFRHDPGTDDERWLEATRNLARRRSEETRGRDRRASGTRAIEGLSAEIPRPHARRRLGTARRPVPRRERPGRAGDRAAGVWGDHPAFSRLPGIAPGGPPDDQLRASRFRVSSRSAQ